MQSKLRIGRICLPDPVRLPTIRPIMDAPSPLASTARLREHGLRVTAQRRAILAAYDDPAAGPLSADEVHESVATELPELARATVYNTLNEFVRAGLLRRIDGLGSARYDDAADDHHHFRCDGCERLFDVEPTGTEAVAIGAGGFEVERTEILFRGRCPDCASS
jgi:Fe2+ or Zn2+ uptake regulation protein